MSMRNASWCNIHCYICRDGCVKCGNVTSKCISKYVMGVFCSFLLDSRGSWPFQRPCWLESSESETRFIGSHCMKYLYFLVCCTGRRTILHQTCAGILCCQWWNCQWEPGNCTLQCWLDKLTFLFVGWAVQCWGSGDRSKMFLRFSNHHWGTCTCNNYKYCYRTH